MYAESIAVDLARVVGVQRGSIAFYGIVGAMEEVIERCAQEAEPAVKRGAITAGAVAAAARIRALATKTSAGGTKHG